MKNAKAPALHTLWSHRSSVLCWGMLLRITLLALGQVQDHLLAVKYTDIDYHVYTDAASLVAQGRSPYERSTYRYTPLMAWLLVPNIWLHTMWGKALFCCADLAAAW